MKPFDILGAVVVASWLVLGGLYVYRVEVAQSGDVRQMDGEFVMHDGETWLTLRRDNREVGFVHQTRTRLEGGWLVENEMLLTVELLGNERAIDSEIRSRLDEDGYLEEFTANVSAASRDFSARGHLEGNTLHTLLDLGGDPRDRTIELEDRPRLSASAFNQLLAAGDLEPGQTFEERYFDPTTMSMTEMSMEYVGEDIIDVYEEQHTAHHIIQRLGSNELDVFVDDRGEILIQEFPLKIVGSRVPPELGRTRASSIRRKLEERQKEKGQSRESDDSQLDLSLEGAMRMLGGQAERDEPGDDATKDTADDADDGDDPAAGPQDAPDAGPHAPSNDAPDSGNPTAP